MSFGAEMKDFLSALTTTTQLGLQYQGLGLDKKRLADQEAERDYSHSRDTKADATAAAAAQQSQKNWQQTYDLDSTKVRQNDTRLSEQSRYHDLVAHSRDRMAAAAEKNADANMVRANRPQKVPAGQQPIDPISYQALSDFPDVAPSAEPQGDGEPTEVPDDTNPDAYDDGYSAGGAVEKPMTPQEKAILQKAMKKGRGRDSGLVHVEPVEEKWLKEQGGRGTINPNTGLREYGLDSGDGHGGQAGNGGGDTGGGGGNNGGGGGRAGNPGGTGTTSSKGGAHSSPEGGGGSVTGNGNPANGPGFGGTHDSTPKPGSVIIGAPKHLNPLTANKDYADDIAGLVNDPGLTPGTYGKLGTFGQMGYGALNALGSLFGVHVSPNAIGSVVETDGDLDNPGSVTSQAPAHDLTSVDPIKAALGLASLASPIGSVLSTGYSVAKLAGFNGPTIIGGSGLGAIGFNGGTLGGIGNPGGTSGGNPGANPGGNPGGNQGGQGTHPAVAPQGNTVFDASKTTSATPGFSDSNPQVPAVQSNLEQAAGQGALQLAGQIPGYTQGLKHGGAVKGYAEGGDVQADQAIPVGDPYGAIPNGPTNDTQQARRDERGAPNPAIIAKYNQSLGAALDHGLKFLQNAFGIEGQQPQQAQALTPADPQRDKAMRALVSGEGAATPEELVQLRQTLNPNGNIDGGSILKTALLASDAHNPNGSVPASLIQHGNQMSQEMGKEAINQFRKGKYQNAADLVAAAYNYAPTPGRMQVKVDNGGNGVMVITDGDGNVTSKTPFNSSQLRQTVISTADGSAYLNHVVEAASKLKAAGPQNLQGQTTVMQQGALPDAGIEAPVQQPNATATAAQQPVPQAAPPAPQQPAPQQGAIPADDPLAPVIAQQQLIQQRDLRGPNSDPSVQNALPPEPAPTLSTPGNPMAITQSAAVNTAPVAPTHPQIMPVKTFSDWVKPYIKGRDPHLITKDTNSNLQKAYKNYAAGVKQQNDSALKNYNDQYRVFQGDRQAWTAQNHRENPSYTPEQMTELQTHIADAWNQVGSKGKLAKMVADNPNLADTFQNAAVGIMSVNPNMTPQDAINISADMVSLDKSDDGQHSRPDVVNFKATQPNGADYVMVTFPNSSMPVKVPARAFDALAVARGAAIKTEHKALDDERADNAKKAARKAEKDAYFKKYDSQAEQMKRRFRAGPAPTNLGVQTAIPQ